MPDSDMLIALSQAPEAPVSTLLGEAVTEAKADDIRAIFEKLEIINLQLAQRKTVRRKTWHWLFLAFCAVIMAIAAVFFVMNSPYQDWNFHDPETAAPGTAFHEFEWAFVRVAPLALIGGIVGTVLTRKKNRETDIKRVKRDRYGRLSQTVVFFPCKPFV